MIKKLFIIITVLCSALTCCGKNSKLDSKISQLRNDIYAYDCKDFTLTALADTVEAPLSSDGAVGKLEKVITFKLKTKNPAQNTENCSIAFSLNKKNYSKDFEFKQIPTLLSCQVKVNELPKKSLEISLTVNGKASQITLKSVKCPSTKSYGDVLKMLSSEEDFAKRIEENAELRIRLINNGGYDYWYVGIIDKEKTVSYLVDGESLEIIAKKSD
ncbi:MAG: hypothetical protein IKA61_02435 [Clostridia bacterium]|nr:hypothetical protein [Clostridia bacterium]